MKEFALFMTKVLFMTKISKQYNIRKSQNGNSVCFIKAPWQIVLCGIPAATPHVGPLGMAFFATQLQGQSIQENTHSDHFCLFRKLSRAVLFNFDKVAEQWNTSNSKFRITGLDIGKMLPMATFFSPKAWSVAFLRHSRTKQFAKAPYQSGRKDYTLKDVTFERIIALSSYNLMNSQWFLLISKHMNVRY